MKASVATAFSFVASMSFSSADVGSIRVSPGFQQEFVQEYGGKTAREAFLKAGVPLAKDDTVEINPRNGMCTISSSAANISFVRTLLEDHYSRSKPTYSDSREIRKMVAGKTVDLKKMDSKFGSATPLSLRFHEDQSASGSYRFTAPKDDFRWAVKQDGTVVVRRSDGSLLFEARVDATARLLASSSGQDKATVLEWNPAS